MRPTIEEWRPVVGYEGRYEVSNLGEARSVTRVVYQKGTYGGKRTICGRVLKYIGKPNDYPMVSLGEGNKTRVHRIVAETFIPNPLNKPCIDHIDGNKWNNAVDNLRWCDHKENNNNPSTKFKLCRRVAQIDASNGAIIKIWSSITSIHNELGIHHISPCCLGKRKTSGGYKWKYVNETEDY